MAMSARTRTSRASSRAWRGRAPLLRARTARTSTRMGTSGRMRISRHSSGFLAEEPADKLGNGEINMSYCGLRRSSAALLVLAAGAHSAHAQVATALLREGDVLSGGIVATSIGNVAANDVGGYGVGCNAGT